MVYDVTCDLASGVTGQLHAGQTVELDADVAAWVNEQAPGTLVPCVVRVGDEYVLPEDTVKRIKKRG